MNIPNVRSQNHLTLVCALCMLDCTHLFNETMLTIARFAIPISLLLFVHLIGRCIFCLKIKALKF